MLDFQYPNDPEMHDHVCNTCGEILDEECIAEDCDKVEYCVTCTPNKSDEDEKDEQE